MPSVRGLAERLWQGELSPSEFHPVHTRLGTGEEIDAGLFYYKGLASAATLDTGDGLVMLDTGAVNDARPLHELVRGWRPQAPLVAAVFSHHHADHVFGVGPFEQEARERGRPVPTVYAHEAMPADFDRYKRTQGWNTAINIRQFEFPPERFRWPADYRYPDVTYERSHEFKVGGLTFALRHGRGETDDATWTWIPERRLLAPGDLFIYAVPNAGNPQKVQRYAGDWAAALREMAALGAETLVPGHGLPLFGADRIRVALSDTAELLESIEAQTLALMNQGANLDRVLHEVTPPAHLLAKPYLRPIYDDPQFLVRNVWRLYGGWYDGEPDNLLPAPRADQAREWIALAGGLDRVLARAEELLAQGDARLACHLVEHAAAVEPRSQAVHALRQRIYLARSEQQQSSRARNIFRHAAHASAQDKRDLAGDW